MIPSRPKESRSCEELNYRELLTNGKHGKKKERKKKKERRKIFPCFPREAAFSQASSLLLLVDCSMTRSPVSWALLARLRSDPASNKKRRFLACIKISNLSSKKKWNQDLDETLSG